MKAAVLIDAARPPAMRAVAEVFAVFLKLGVTSFGGPVAHLGYFLEELVQRRRWIDEAGYADLIALCQFLPGLASPFRPPFYSSPSPSGRVLSTGRLRMA